MKRSDGQRTGPGRTLWSTGSVLYVTVWWDGVDLRVSQKADVDLYVGVFIPDTLWAALVPTSLSSATKKQTVKT